MLRTVEYEKRPQAGADWYHKGMGVASNQGPGDDSEYDNEHMDNIRADLLAFTYTEVDQIYDPDRHGGDGDGRPERRAGASSTTPATASTTSWSSTGFSNTHVERADQRQHAAVHHQRGVRERQFDGYTCFAEAWLRATNGGEPTGAIGTYMSSINQSWDPPMDAQDEIADLLVGTSAEACTRTFGGICFNGCGHMMDEYGTGGESEFLHLAHLRRPVAPRPDRHAADDHRDAPPGHLPEHDDVRRSV